MIDYRNTVKKIDESIALILTVNPQNNEISGKGSGFIFPKKGFIVTCNHVALDGHQIKVRFSDETSNYLDAKVVLRDEEHDLALLRYDEKLHNAGPIETYEGEVSSGMPVLFAGYPLTLMNLTSHQGILSAILKDSLNSTVYLIDGTVNPGNSGCPLMSSDGKLIGVVNATRRESVELLAEVNKLPIGVLSILGVDLLAVQQALIKNLQLGIGYAVPSNYIPEFKERSHENTKSSAKKQTREF